MQKTLIILLLAATAVFQGCSSEQVPFVHRIDIPQGNVVTQDMLEKLEPGLTQRQVQYIMGSPMLVDVFNQDEWVYLYSFKPGGGERVQRRVSLYFEGGRLARLDGDLRKEVDYAVAGSTTGQTRTVDVPAHYRDEDGGFLRTLIESFGDVTPWGEPELREKAEATPEEAAPEDAAERATLRQRFSLGQQDVNPAPGAAAEPAVPGTGADTDTPPAPVEPPAEAMVDDEPPPEDESFFDRLRRSLGLDDDETPAEEGRSSP